MRGGEGGGKEMRETEMSEVSLSSSYSWEPRIGLCGTANLHF